MTAVRYQLAPGLEAVALGGDAFELRSDFTAVKLSGETAVELVEKVFPALERPRTFEEVLALLPEYRPESLRSQLESLVEEGVLVARSGSGAGGPATFAALLDELGFGAEETLAQLRGSRVAVFGLEAQGAHVAQLLADAGVGELVLADPFPFEPAHYELTPVRDPAAIGLSREEAVSRWLARPGLEVATAGPEPFDRARVRALADGCRLLVVGWDRAFQSANQWANEAALELGVPALFSELRSTRAIAGPLLLPGRSACWMCYRMRAVAAERDFELAMAYEEHLDRVKRPRLAARAVLPGLAPQLGSSLFLEALKLLLRLNQPTLADKVRILDGLSSETRAHPVLVEPYCPACSKKNSARSPGPTSWSRPRAATVDRSPSGPAS